MNNHKCAGVSLLVSLHSLEGVGEPCQHVQQVTSGLGARVSVRLGLI